MLVRATVSAYKRDLMTAHPEPVIFHLSISSNALPFVSGQMKMAQRRCAHRQTPKNANIAAGAHAAAIAGKTNVSAAQKDQ